MERSCTRMLAAYKLEFKSLHVMRLLGVDIPVYFIFKEIAFLLIIFVVVAQTSWISNLVIHLFGVKRKCFPLDGDPILFFFDTQFRVILYYFSWEFSSTSYSKDCL